MQIYHSSSGSHITRWHSYTQPSGLWALTCHAPVHGPSPGGDFAHGLMVLRSAWCALKLLELQALAHQIQFQQYCAMAKTVLDTFNQIHVESALRKPVKQPQLNTNSSNFSN